MHAIIETGGKQYRVRKGDIIYIEKLDVNPGDVVSFDKVLAVIDGDKFRAGNPLLSGCTVEGKAVKNARAKKIIVFKFHAKKNYRRKQGHRQPYTKVEITKVSV